MTPYNFPVGSATSARGTVEASVDWTSFPKDSFSRYMNVCFTFGCVHGPYV